MLSASQQAKNVVAGSASGSTGGAASGADCIIDGEYEGRERSDGSMTKLIYVSTTAQSCSNGSPSRNQLDNSLKTFCGQMTATLQNKDLWKTFCISGNEMMVTKQGR